MRYTDQIYDMQRFRGLDVPESNGSVRSTRNQSFSGSLNSPDRPAVSFVSSKTLSALRIPSLSNARLERISTERGGDCSFAINQLKIAYICCVYVPSICFRCSFRCISMFTQCGVLHHQTHYRTEADISPTATSLYNYQTITRWCSCYFFKYTSG